MTKINHINVLELHLFLWFRWISPSLGIFRLSRRSMMNVYEFFHSEKKSTTVSVSGSEGLTGRTIKSS